MIDYECPLCDGAGRLEYERPVVDWVHGGYLEGYMDDCEKCDGAGEVQIEMSFLSWCRERREDDCYGEPVKPCLKEWFKANRDQMLGEWKQEEGLLIS